MVAWVFQQVAQRGRLDGFFPYWGAAQVLAFTLDIYKAVEPAAETRGARPRAEQQGPDFLTLSEWLDLSRERLWQDTHGVIEALSVRSLGMYDACKHPGGRYSREIAGQSAAPQGGGLSKALGLRHVGYGIPTDLFGPFVSRDPQVFGQVPQLMAVLSAPPELNSQATVPRLGH